MVRVRKRVSQGRFASRGGRRFRRRSAEFDEDSGKFGRLAKPDAVEQSLLNLDSHRDFETETATTGWRDVVFGWFARSKPKELAAANPSDPDDDPVRDILAVARGPARLDAFQRTLEHLAPGTAGHRGVALAFHRELTGLAEQAAVNLSLLKARVEACAKALMAAEEHEVAGMLLARIGRRHKAAEMFVAAGALDKLERAHAEIEEREGGDRLSARLAYERFEGLFLVGFRNEALQALEDACRLWPDHPVYDDIRDRFRLRIPEKTGVLLRGASHSTILRRAWPLSVGRDDDAALSLKSPLVSRRHLEFVVSHATMRVLPIEVPSETLVDGSPLTRGRDLHAPSGEIDIRGVSLGYALTDEALMVWSNHGQGPKLYAPLGQTFDLPVGPVSIPLQIDASGHLLVRPTEGIRVGGESIRRPMLLLCDDRIDIDGHVIDVIRP